MLLHVCAYSCWSKKVVVCNYFPGESALEGVAVVLAHHMIK
jgi:hypothetical protein